MRAERLAWGVRVAVTVCAAALVAAAAPLTGVAAAVAGCAGGVVLVAVAPGEALVAALFPSGRAGPSRVERAVYGLALSLACAALGGFLLNLLPGGLRTTSWAILLGGIAVAAASVAAARHDTGPPLPRMRLPRRQAVLVTAAAVLAAAAVTTATVGAARLPGRSFAELWMIRADAATARIGVHSDTHGSQAYVLSLSRGGVQVRRWTITLVPGETWRTTVPAPPRAGLRATLYRDTSTIPYRHVTLRPPAR